MTDKDAKRLLRVMLRKHRDDLAADEEADLQGWLDTATAFAAPTAPTAVTSSGRVKKERGGRALNMFSKHVHARLDNDMVDALTKEAASAKDDSLKELGLAMGRIPVIESGETQKEYASRAQETLIRCMRLAGHCRNPHGKYAIKPGVFDRHTFKRYTASCEACHAEWGLYVKPSLDDLDYWVCTSLRIDSQPFESEGGSAVRQWLKKGLSCSEDPRACGLRTAPSMRGASELPHGVPSNCRLLLPTACFCQLPRCCQLPATAHVPPQ